jgi:hypothetical protein
MRLLGVIIESMAVAVSIGGCITSAQREATRVQTAFQAGIAGSSRDALYALKGIYFDVKSYKSEADCLTAAYDLRLPLDLCKHR